MGESSLAAHCLAQLPHTSATQGSFYLARRPGHARPMGNGLGGHLCVNVRVAVLVDKLCGAYYNDC